MTSMLKLIEEGLVAAVKAALPDADVESYAGQLDDEHAEWMRRLPCAWVTFERTVGVKVIGRRTVLRTVRFQVLVAQQMHGPNPATRLGDHGQQGLYELLDEHVLAALLHEKLGLPIEPLVPVETKMVLQGYFGNEAAAVMAAGWQTRYSETIPAPGAPINDLVTVGLNYPIKPGDDVPDGADVVTLNP
jgi:phage gp37-like protein